MAYRSIAFGALGAIAVAVLAPAAASAQSFGVYVGSGSPSYYEPGYAYQGYYDRDDARRAAWIAHQRWEQRERWERQQQARRASWAHQRWEDQQRHRYWDHERWEHRHDWHDDDDD